MVLEKGMPLLASAGQEFDQAIQELSSLDPKERLPFHTHSLTPFQD